MGYIFEWDHGKAKANFRKHGVSFEEASTVFGDVRSVTVHDPAHLDEEDRFVDIGFSVKLRVLVVLYVERGDKVRIISARMATVKEQKIYEKQYP
jgi:uncharacterized DUF497 family protein